MRLHEHRKDNIVEIIYFDQTQVFEGSTSNIFAVINDKLVTPSSKLLPGITRKLILENFATPVLVEDFKITDLKRASEIFLTGSNKEIMPVTTLDGNPVGNGTVGEISKTIIKEFRTYVEAGEFS